MLIALLTIFFLGGSTTGMLSYIADTKDNVKTVMVKDERREETLAVLKAMKKRANAQYNDDMLDLRFELKEHVNREEWEVIFSGD